MTSTDNIMTIETAREARRLGRSRHRSDEESLLVRHTPLTMAFRHLALAVDALDVICLLTMDNDLIAAAERSQDDMLAIMHTIPPRFRPNSDVRSCWLRRGRPLPVRRRDHGY